MNQRIVLDPTKDTQLRLQDLGVTHFIGIGGAGMSVLAEILHEEGIHVQGSDRDKSAKACHLLELGIDVRFGHNAQNVNGVDTVVYSSAIKPDNVEIMVAAQQGIRIVHRSDILALIMNRKQSVTVAGAHGKSTTSSLLSHILLNASGDLADPSYAIGASIQGDNGVVLDGGHAGKGVAFVAEADESDGSFEKYHPDIVVITNVEPDHLDHYGTVQKYHQAFVKHATHAKKAVVLCTDDEGSRIVLQSLSSQDVQHCVCYGTEPLSEQELRGVSFVHITHESEQSGNGKESFTIEFPHKIADGKRVLVELLIPGIHNARNATAAIISAVLLGMPATQAAQAAGTFHGAQRRFQIIGTALGVTVVDDYAHHPTEITALLEAARRRYPNATLRVVFQPHLFSRTKFFAHEFAQALSLADYVIVTGIFPAREKQEDYPNIHAQTIVDAVKDLQADTNFTVVEDMGQAAQIVAQQAQSGDVIFTVGAGSITTVAPIIVSELNKR
ncbi:MAG: UDP-N-acetylmuramate--L-alanine ligase [Bifidobacteriaceae bacterium]|nr:UDP-N-acetylmuramate--L-alanine ligase [Bifidobacteriaceae bacterium]